VTARRGAWWLVGSAAAVAVLVAACGVPTTDGAERIDSDDLPDVLLEPTTTTTTTTTTLPTSTTSEPAPTTTAAPTTTTIAQAAPLTIWLVLDGTYLVQVPRSFNDPTVPIPGVDQAIALLEDGPTAAELAAGIDTAIPAPGLFYLAAAPDRGRVTVVLTPAFFEQVVDVEQPRAIGQIVNTITGAPNTRVSQVFFVKEEDPSTNIQVFSGDGQLIDYGQAEDYASITTIVTAPPTTAAG
jgi:hypothetical protein